MDFNDGAVEADRLKLNAHELLLLQLLKDSVEHPGLCPPIHARIDRMPIPKSLRQRPPFTSVLGDIQDRVDHVEVLMRHIAALAGQKRCDTSELLGCDFHAVIISNSVNTP